MADPDAPCMRSYALVCETTLSRMSRQGRGMESVIKLKRLGEDELLMRADIGYITLTQFTPLLETDWEGEGAGTGVNL